MLQNITVYTSACDEYDYLKIKNILSSHFDNIISECFENFDFKNKTVALKPNLLAKRKPAAGITTNPVFVKAAAEYFKDKGARVVICDSPGGVYNASALSAIYNVCEMKTAAEQSGAELNLDTGFSEMFNKDGVVSKSFNIINPLAKADFIVNLCRLKTHSLCNMSAAVKNMYGSVPGLQKAEQHARFPEQKNFSEYLIDLCSTVNPSISVIDSIVAMEGNGPAGGTLKKVGLVLSSANPYVLDYAASHIMGFTPDEVLTVKNSMLRGLCPQKLEDIIVKGVDIEPFVSEFKRPDSSSGGLIKQIPSIFGGRLQKWLEPRPYVEKSKCVGCGECAACCPQTTIEIIDRKACINYEKCIKCYCCQELCPMKAVVIKRNLFMKL